MVDRKIKKKPTTHICHIISMELSIGPVLKKKQSEWEDLLHVTELEVPEPEPCALTGSDRIALAALWFQDARKGRRIYYPQDNFGLICYKISLSGYTLSLYTCAILLHMSIPFLTRPNCPWDTRNDTDVHFRSNKHHSGMFIPMETATIIGFICILIYYLEVIIRWNINFLGSKTILEDPWVLFRFITAILLTLGTIQKFKDPHAVTFFISLLPFVYISRRPSLRYMCRAVYLAFKECFSILVFLFFLILFFGFIGFLVFSNVQTPDDGIRANFISLPKSVMTCLHSFSARGFAIYALDPYFTTRSTSAIFFVCLSVITDIFCTALIIATGNRQFRLFADTIFNEQLLARKLAIITIHRSLATMSSAGDIKTAASMQAGNELTIDVGTWCKFATTVTSEYSLAFHELLFAAECDSETGRADCAAFCRMCAILASRKTMSGGACTAELIHKRVSFADRLSSISRVSRGLAMSDVNGNGIELSPPTSMSPENEKMDIKQPHDSEIVTLTRVFKSYYVIFVTNYISPMLEKTVSVPNCFTGSEPSKFNLFKCYEFLIRVLLIMQLVNICNTDKHQKFWFVVGWILEVNFIVEAFLNSMHLGFRRYIRNTGFGYVHVINVATFCLMIRVGQVRTDQRANDSDFIALVGLQSIRIVRFFKLLKDSALFNSILPLLLRVVVLVTCVIYFFAVFAHNRFCDTLRVSAAENNDDISDQWISYENMLNFETFPLAMFTLFEISILGNWSMVNMMNNIITVDGQLHNFAGDASKCTSGASGFFVLFLHFPVDNDVGSVTAPEFLYHSVIHCSKRASPNGKHSNKRI